MLCFTHIKVFANVTSVTLVYSNILKSIYLTNKFNECNVYFSFITQFGILQDYSNLATPAKKEAVKSRSLHSRKL